MPRAHIDALAPDLGNTPMRGVFPSVTQADEVALRAAGYVPVLRWARQHSQQERSDREMYWNFP